MKSAEAWAAQLQLQAHPEGGFYKETYRSPLRMVHNGIERPVSTAIYFLLPEGVISAWHRLDADELWHFYHGGPLLIHSWQKGALQTDVLDADRFSLLMPANTWFATEPAAGAGFSLCGCTVAPGFSFERFEIAEEAQMEEKGWSAGVRRLIKPAEGKGKD